MNDHINVSSEAKRCIANPNSHDSLIFIDGFRTAMNWLREVEPSRYAYVLATTNHRHILASIVDYELVQKQRRLEDVCSILREYSYDKGKLLAFLFDRENISSTTGLTYDGERNPLENDNFEPLGDEIPAGWPDYSITRYDYRGKEKTNITREEYIKLPEEERAKCSYTRYFWLTFRGEPAYKISSDDIVMMEELIRRLIKIGDIAVNRRFLKMLDYDFDRKYGDFSGNLYCYNDAITGDLSYREHSSALTPMFFGEAHFENGTVKENFAYEIREEGGRPIIRDCSGNVAAREISLLDSMENIYEDDNGDVLIYATLPEIIAWTNLINSIRGSNGQVLTELITEADIEKFKEARQDEEYLFGSHALRVSFGYIDIKKTIIPHLAQKLTRIFKGDGLRRKLKADPRYASTYMAYMDLAFALHAAGFLKAPTLRALQAIQPIYADRIPFKEHNADSCEIAGAICEGDPINRRFVEKPETEDSTPSDGDEELAIPGVHKAEKPDAHEKPVAFQNLEVVRRVATEVKHRGIDALLELTVEDACTTGLAIIASRKNAQNILIELIFGPEVSEDSIDVAVYDRYSSWLEQSVVPELVRTINCAFRNLVESKRELSFEDRCLHLLQIGLAMYESGCLDKKIFDALFSFEAMYSDVL